MTSPLRTVFRTLSASKGEIDAEAVECLWRDACKRLTLGLADGRLQGLATLLAGRDRCCWKQLLKAIGWMQLGCHAASGIACRQARDLLSAARLKGLLHPLFLASLDVHEAWYQCRVGKYCDARSLCYEALDLRSELPERARFRLAAEASFALAYTAYRERRIAEARGYASYAQQQAEKAWEESGWSAARSLLLASGMNLPLLRHQIALFEWQLEEQRKEYEAAAFVASPCEHLLLRAHAKHAQAQFHLNQLELTRDICTSILSVAGWKWPLCGGEAVKPAFERHVEPCLEAIRYLVHLALLEAYELPDAARREKLNEAAALLAASKALLDRIGNPRERIVFALLDGDVARCRNEMAQARESLQHAEQLRGKLPQDWTVEHKIELAKARTDRAAQRVQDATTAYHGTIQRLRVVRPSRLLAVIEAEYAFFLEPIDPQLARVYWANVYDLVKAPGDPLFQEAARRIQTWSPQDWCQVMSRAVRGDLAALPAGSDPAGARRGSALQRILLGIEHDLAAEFKDLFDQLTEPGDVLTRLSMPLEHVRELAQHAVELAQHRLEIGADSQSQPINVQVLLEEVCRALAGRSERVLGRPIEPRCEPGLPLACGHGLYLRRAVTNILVNALDALEEAVGARRAPSAAAPAVPKITVRACAEGSGVRIGIFNSATRLAPRVERELFQLGNTGGKGHGTGLHFAQCAVHLSNGSITGGNVHDGVAFHIWLPAWTS